MHIFDLITLIINCALFKELLHNLSKNLHKSSGPVFILNLRYVYTDTSLKNVRETAKSHHI